MDWINQYVTGMAAASFNVKKLQTSQVYKYKLKFKRCAGLVDHVMPGLMEYNQVHLYDWGYRVLVTGILASLLKKWHTHFA